MAHLLYSIYSITAALAGPRVCKGRYDLQYLQHNSTRFIKKEFLAAKMATIVVCMSSSPVHHLLSPFVYAIDQTNSDNTLERRGTASC